MRLEAQPRFAVLEGIASVSLLAALAIFLHAKDARANAGEGTTMPDQAAKDPAGVIGAMDERGAPGAASPAGAPGWAAAGI